MTNPDDNSENENSPYIPPYPLFLSSFDMKLIMEVAQEGQKALYNNPVAQDTIQALAVAIVASMRVDGLNSDATPLPLPLCLTVTTMFPVTGGNT